jgi:hypothetical protein
MKMSEADSNETSFAVPKTFVWGLIATCIVQAVAGIWLLATVVQRVAHVEKQSEGLERSLVEMRNTVGDIRSDIRVLLERTRPSNPRNSLSPLNPGDLSDVLIPR